MPFAFDLYPNLQAMSLGSGFIIEETGLIVTNYHVIAGSDEIHVKLSDNTELPAVIIGRDPQTDLALIKINSTKKLPFVSFGNSNEARVGDVVIAIGNSLGFGGTVTTGIISSKGRDLGSGMDELVDDFIQTDAAINTGNSGGPLFNIEGKVIGINTSIPAVSGGTNVGIGFAIPSNKAQNIVDQLKKNGKISRGKLDIAIQENTKELSEALNIDKDYGVLVVDVKIGGSGDKAGLKRGDLIIGFNEKEVINSRKLQLFVAETKIGEEVKLTIIRNGKTLDLKAQISEVTDDEEDLEEDENNFSPKNINTKNLLEKSGVVFTNVSED
jgi:serine protease Do